ncbi:helix-turn-helix domain-containing protein [Paenibacillus sp. FSL R10-2791]|uniref:helix-turn-helix domain-containing protein n=1 Tax=Paenibacillus sp. FSL R10-2791 TaxID=2954695 RepID=UPI0030F6474D
MVRAMLSHNHRQPEILFFIFPKLFNKIIHSYIIKYAIYGGLMMVYTALISVKQHKMYDLLFQDFPDVVNITEMCEMLGGISSKSAYKLLQEGKISYFKIGRVYKIPKINILMYLDLFIFNFDQPNFNTLLH